MKRFFENYGTLLLIALFAIGVTVLGVLRWRWCVGYLLTGGAYTAAVSLARFYFIKYVEPNGAGPVPLRYALLFVVAWPLILFASISNFMDGWREARARRGE